MNGGDNTKIRLFCAITLGEFGGAQQFLLQLLGSLDPERYEIMVVTGARGRQDMASQLPASVTWQTSQHLKRAIDPVSDIRAISELRTMISTARPDIVLLVSSKAGFVGSRAAHTLRKKLPHMRVIYRIGGWSFNDPWPLWKKRLFTWMERFSAPWKDVIVVNNKRDLKQARRLGIKSRHGTVLIHNGTDPYWELLPRHEARQQLASRVAETSRARPTLDRVAGVVANFYPAKGLLTLLDAVGKGPEDLQYIIIGDGPLRSVLEERIAHLGLEKRVFLTGMLPNARRFLSAFDLFILPSLKEGFPWSVLEAMAAKIPIVATTVGAVPEILSDGASARLVQAGDAEQLAQAISDVCDNEQLSQKFVIRAHQELLAKYTLQTMATHFERLFTALQNEYQEGEH